MHASTVFQLNQNNSVGTAMYPDLPTTTHNNTKPFTHSIVESNSVRPIMEGLGPDLTKIRSLLTV